MVTKDALKKQPVKTKTKRIARLEDDIEVKILKGKRVKQIANMETPPSDYALVAEMVQSPELSENDLLELDMELFDQIRKACFDANGIGEDEDEAKKN